MDKIVNVILILLWTLIGFMVMASDGNPTKFQYGALLGVYLLSRLERMI